MSLDRLQCQLGSSSQNFFKLFFVGEDDALLCNTIYRKYLIKIQNTYVSFGPKLNGEHVNEGVVLLHSILPVIWTAGFKMIMFYWNVDKHGSNKLIK